MSQQSARIAVAITINQSLSAAVALHGGRVSVIEMSAGWDAANLTFQGSNDNSTWFDLFDDAGAEVVVQAGAGRRIDINTSSVSNQAYLKVRSGIAAIPVNQTAGRTLYLEIWS